MYNRGVVTGRATNGGCMYWFYYVSPEGEAILDGERECSSMEEAMNFARRLSYEARRQVRVELVAPDANMFVGTVHYS